MSALDWPGSMMWPRRIAFNPLLAPDDSSGTITYVQSSSAIAGGHVQTSGAQNEYVAYNALLGPGTWTIDAVYQINTDSGIITAQIDGVTVGTMDTYGTFAYNTRSSISGIAVVGAAQRVLKLLMTTKNASSTGYRLRLQSLGLRRTGA